MAANNHIINSFVAGEISPGAFGRTEVAQYNQALDKSFNSVVHTQGGASRRTGTAFVRNILNAAGNRPDRAINIPFNASDGTRWQLVLSSDAPDIPGGYTPGVSTTALNWFAVNTRDYELSYIMGDFPHPVVNPWWFDDYYEDFVTPLAPVHWAQSGDMIVLTNGLHRPIRIYYEPDVTANTPKFYMTPYPDFWDATVSNQQAWRQMPFEEPVIQSVGNDLAINLAADGSGNLTISPGSGSLVTFDANWHGKYIKFTRSGTPAAVVVMVYDVDSSTSAKVISIGGSAPAAGTNLDYGGATAANYYEVGYWDEEKGWPRTVTFFDSRMVFGGTDTYPDNLWLSEQNDFDEFDVNKLISDSDFGDPVAATDMYGITLKSETLNKVCWLSPGKSLAAGTSAREFIVRAPDEAQNIGPLNTAQDAETPHGGAYIQPARVENAVVFMQRDFRTLRELIFNLGEDSFKAANLNIIAEHMGKKWRSMVDDPVNGGVIYPGYFRQMARQELPDSILWVMNNTGGLCGLTREREQQVNAWHYHEIAGDGFIFNGDEYPPCIVSISCSQKEVNNPNKEGQPDELWMIVLRGKGPSGTPVLYLEKMMQPWDRKEIDSNWVVDAEPKVAPVYMDCAIMTDATTERLAGRAQGIIGGLPHGEGARVSVVVNGSYIGDFTVSASDNIDISEAIPDLLEASHSDDSWQAIVGFNFSAYIVPITPEVQAIKGTSQGQERRVHTLEIHFKDTIGAKFGKYTDEIEENTPYHDLEEIEFDLGEDADNPIPFFTGVKKVTFNPGYELRPRIMVRSDVPLPMHVTHIVAEMVVNE